MDKLADESGGRNGEKMKSGNTRMNHAALRSQVKVVEVGGVSIETPVLS